MRSARVPHGEGGRGGPSALPHSRLVRHRHPVSADNSVHAISSPCVPVTYERDSEPAAPASVKRPGTRRLRSGSRSRRRRDGLPGRYGGGAVRGGPVRDLPGGVVEPGVRLGVLGVESPIVQRGQVDRRDPRQPLLGPQTPGGGRPGLQPVLVPHHFTSSRAAPTPRGRPPRRCPGSDGRSCRAGRRCAGAPGRTRARAPTGSRGAADRVRTSRRRRATGGEGGVRAAALHQHPGQTVEFGATAQCAGRVREVGLPLQHGDRGLARALDGRLCRLPCAP